MNLNKILDKAYEGKSLKEIAAAPVAAIEGVSENDGKLLKEAFGIETIADLGTNKFFLAAQALTELAKYEE
jgi:hypothetical protein